MIGSLIMGLFLSNWQYIMPSLLILLLVYVMIGTLRLRASYKYYLRFHMPFATVLSAQLIAFLLTLTVADMLDARLVYRIILFFIPLVR